MLCLKAGKRGEMPRSQAQLLPLQLVRCALQHAPHGACEDSWLALCCLDEVFNASGHDGVSSHHCVSNLLAYTAIGLEDMAMVDEHLAAHGSTCERQAWTLGTFSCHTVLEIAMQKSGRYQHSTQHPGAYTAYMHCDPSHATSEGVLLTDDRHCSTLAGNAIDRAQPDTLEPSM